MVPSGGIDCQENFRGEKTRLGEAYSGFACIGLGSASVSISVNKVGRAALQSYAPMILKQILKSRKLSTEGGKDELVEWLAQYIVARVQTTRCRSRSRSRSGSMVGQALPGC